MELVCDRNKCTLCMACSNACPKQAIYVGKDQSGYEAICIDPAKCIDCGICQKVCNARDTVERNTSHTGYAAQAIDREALMKSASGGAFQMLAEYVLEQNGVCYGCNATFAEDGMHACHLRVDNITDLPKILNTKYIPSIVGDSFRLAKKDLQSGKTVLFSGTPCQIQGLKAYLGKTYENLLTADLICHGVTSSYIFNDYIKTEERKYGIKIVDYSFRDKSVAWGTNFCYQYYDLNGPPKKIKTKHLPREASSYTVHYLKGDIFRENCYVCKLANTNRVSDFTFGDYWGIEAEHPELITQQKPKILLRKGVSCILANTEKARQYIFVLKEKMIIHEVSVESIVSHNSNLYRTTERGTKREVFLKGYSEQGYDYIERDYESSTGKKMKVYKLKNALKAHLPDRIRVWIYNNKRLSKFVFH